MPPKYKKKINPDYDYDTLPWIERESRKTNYDRKRPMTEKGRKKLKEMRDKEEVATTRSYEDKRDDEIEDLERAVKEDEDTPLFLQDREKRRADSREKARRIETRRRGTKATRETEKTRDKILTQDSKVKEGNAKSKGDWTKGYSEERRQKLFNTPGWAEWSKDRIQKFLAEED